MLEEVDPTQIKDEATRQLVVKLLNLLENALQENKILKEEIQRLRDENNRLKGEQDKPDIKPNRPGNTNYASEKERHYKRPHKKGSKHTKPYH